MCESEAGRGTSFTIELPEALEPPRRKSGAPEASNTETVLLVDDELALRKVMRIILEQAGFRVLEAVDGQAGLELLLQRRDAIDLVVLDRSMPRMSGEQLLVELRGRAIQVPVIIVTGHGSSGAASEGVAAVLYKPVACGELVRSIRSALDCAAVSG